ncbi:hypothetical protein ED28_09535 [[Pantoea] beijingensis]|uniref:DUF1275 domain-containing protein n=1 Tax=[Pantoea] beijingensis TaxID=1324864 RepID=A0A443ICV2_9GAMM|nr:MULTISPECIES: YoaK family protein [Erwiniaceae]RWR01873.1 hypothetical protein ED28_09535 [[Pantoea] beijingensis]
MLISVDDARSINTDSKLACILAIVAGALNTVAFEIVGFFSANMTGNVSLLSDKLARFYGHAGIFFLLIVCFFIAGAAVSTMVINAGRRRGIRAIYAVNIILEALALIALGVVEFWFQPESAGEILILSLSFLMGLQNAVVTRISNARVRTTHVSGTATDIGIELAMLIDILRRKESPKEAPAFIARLKLHCYTIFSFLMGGVAGIWLYHLIGFFFLILIGGGLLCMALYAVLSTFKQVKLV